MSKLLCTYNVFDTLLSDPQQYYRHRPSQARDKVACLQRHISIDSDMLEHAHTAMVVTATL